jgi:hypothetical protein
LPTIRGVRFVENKGFADANRRIVGNNKKGRSRRGFGFIFLMLLRDFVYMPTIRADDSFSRGSFANFNPDRQL